jgi:hypothetical protein
MKRDLDFYYFFEDDMSFYPKIQMRYVEMGFLGMLIIYIKNH